MNDPVLFSKYFPCKHNLFLLCLSLLQLNISQEAMKLSAQ